MTNQDIVNFVCQLSNTAVTFTLEKKNGFTKP